MQKDAAFSNAMSGFYHAMSMVHLDLDEFEIAQVHAEKALNLAQENKEMFYEGYSWTILGRILGKKETKQINEAEEYILKGIKILEKLKLDPMSI